MGWHFYCDHCDKVLHGAYQCLWLEDELGKPYDMVMVHYKCKAKFIATHEGDWYSRGWPAIDLNLTAT